MAKSKGASKAKKPKPKAAGAKPKAAAPKKKPATGKSAPGKAAKRPRKSPWREIRVALIALIWLGLVAAGFIAYVAHDLPDSDSLTGPKSAPAVTILAEAVARTKTETHRLLRQQHAWFQADDERIHWFDVDHAGFESEVSTLVGDFLGGS